MQNLSLLKYIPLINLDYCAKSCVGQIYFFDKSRLLCTILAIKKSSVNKSKLMHDLGPIKEILLTNPDYRVQSWPSKKFN